MADKENLLRFNFRGSYDDLIPVENGELVRAFDYDRLAAKLAEVEEDCDDLQIALASARKQLERYIGEAEAALPAVYRLALADAGLICEQLAEVELTVPNPPYVEGYSDAASICFENIRELPTPTAAELMARIQTGEKE